MSAPAFHQVSWTLDDGGGVRADFTCTAADSEVCRLTCSKDQCEQLPCDHAVIAKQGRCLFADWFDASGDDPAELYTGEKTTPHDGPVEPEWQGDYYTWEYAS